MLKKTITFTNPFTDEEVTEDHYFHISKADLVEMEMEENKASYTTKDGRDLTGMQAKLQRVVDSDDGRTIMFEFKEIIRRAYGKKDGDRFLKSREISDNFAATEAHSQLIFEICTDPNAAAAFVEGIIPKNLEQVAADIQAQAEKTAPKVISEEPVIEEAAKEEPRPKKDPTGLTETVTPRVLTQAQVVEMDPAELKSGLADGRYKLA